VVHVSPAFEEGLVCVELSDAEDVALLLLMAADVNKFLWRTFLQVPMGFESGHLDIDSCIAGLGGDEP